RIAAAISKLQRLDPLDQGKHGLFAAVRVEAGGKAGGDGDAELAELAQVQLLPVTALVVGLGLGHRRAASADPGGAKLPRTGIRPAAPAARHAFRGCPRAARTGSFRPLPAKEGPMQPWLLS